MTFASMESGDDNEPLAEINMVPLIDVMLVLLIIFMVTAPLLTHAIKVDLPKASSAPNITKRHAASVYEALLYEGVIVRPVASYGMPRHLRVTVGLAQENERFIAAFEKVLYR